MLQGKDKTKQQQQKTQLRNNDDACQQRHTHLFLCVSVRALPWNMSCWNGVALMAVKVARRWKTVSPRIIVPFLPFSLCCVFVVQFPQSLQMRAISWSYLSAVQGPERNILPDGWMIVRRPRTRQTVPHPPNHFCPAQITDPPTPSLLQSVDKKHRHTRHWRDQKYIFVLEHVMYFAETQISED